MNCVGGAPISWHLSSSPSPSPSPSPRRHTYALAAPPSAVWKLEQEAGAEIEVPGRGGATAMHNDARTQSAQSGCFKISQKRKTTRETRDQESSEKKDHRDKRDTREQEDSEKKTIEIREIPESKKTRKRKTQRS
ncbi:unnamed protein product [Diplocarpon coronariae]